MNVYTAQIGYQGTPRQVVIDTTVKSAQGLSRAFAPTWDMVMGHKRGMLSWEQYTAMYYDLLRQRYHENDLPFVAVFHTALMVPRIKKRYDIVFTCYCRAGTHCHRLLLVDIFEKIARSRHVPFEYKGELGRTGHCGGDSGGNSGDSLQLLPDLDDDDDNSIGAVEDLGSGRESIE